MKRTPTPQDEGALLGAGFMGHEFALIAGPENERKLRCHQNDDTIRETPGHPYTDPKVYRLIRFKTCRGHRWRRVR